MSVLPRKADIGQLRCRLRWASSANGGAELVDKRLALEAKAAVYLGSLLAHGAAVLNRAASTRPCRLAFVLVQPAINGF
jgi:hypothetical protein